MATVLVCDDEESIRSFVVVNLKREGYTVVEVGSGEEALAALEADSTIELALLDVMLPGIDGFETCRRMRQKSKTLGIIMLTARTQEQEKVNGFQMGADDYVTKPFGPAELLARMDALHRRLEQTVSVQSAEHLERAEYPEVISSGDFVLHLRRRQLTVGGKTVELTQMEYAMMEYFFRHEGQPLSRADILQAVWGDNYYGDDKIVDVNVRRLRMKMEPTPSEPRHILTVWGRGYQWNG